MAFKIMNAPPAIRPDLLAWSALVIASVSVMSCTNQRTRVAVALTGGDPVRGAAAIYRYGCGSCHEVGGLNNAKGLVRPSLTGLRRRSYVAGVLQNTPSNLVHWIRKPKEVNDRTAMPDLGVTERDATDIAAYIYSTE